MQKTTFKVEKMDCPSEEQMIRMRLRDLEEVAGMEFDIPNRLVVIYHAGDYAEVFKRLDSLNFGTSLIRSESNSATNPPLNTTNERRLLRQVLWVNFVFFVLEIVTGYVGNSMGLIADSLDMLADSLVYGLALLAVGGTIIRKRNVARAAGAFQLVLAIAGFVEVVRRFIGLESAPDFRLMIVISVFALIANWMCLYLLQKGRSKDAHMRASMIFTSNDVIVNLGVIVAGMVVYITNSKYPDLIIGTIVFGLVAFGSFRIFKLAR